MNPNKLFDGLKYELTKPVEAEISGLAYDSRSVIAGNIFFCIKGYSTDGHKYAAAAAAAGAACIVVSEKQDVDVPQMIVSDTREAMAVISANYCGRPADKLRMIGITGTNGKTSTTYMIKRILERMGSKVGLIGTIESIVGDKRVHSERTTPESMDLQFMLRDMLEAGCYTVVMEVSSHSLYLKRVFGIRFAVGVFSNLTQDHLDFHKDMDDYAGAKAILFENSDISVINEDDAYSTLMKEHASGEIRTYAIDKKADLNACDVQLSPSGCRYVLSSQQFRIPVLISIPGRFSVYNSLAAAAACLSAGAELLDVKIGLEQMECVPGRFETLDTRGRDFSIILDYCHTPDSLESTLRTVRGFAKGRIVCVFGCGGNRDAKKRPIMGGIAGKLADFSIITSDNPRFEEPCAIINEIVPGMEASGGDYVVIENRRDAIKYALENAKSRDVIILAGKGHEDYQEICGVKHPFDEKVITAGLMEELYP